MIIMGVSGTSERDHDPSCCIIVDGKLIAMVEEERFTREKHAPGFAPYNSIKYCLKEANCTLDNLDYVCLGWDNTLNPLWAKEHRDENLEKVLFPKKIFEYKSKINFKMYSHHLAHAASTFLFSGFNESLIMVMDGQGENESTTLGFGFTHKGVRKISFLKKYPIELSMGYMYDKVGEYIGLGHWSAGKLMGLSAYGEKTYNIPIEYFSDGDFRINYTEYFLQDKNNLDDEDQMKILWTKLLKKTVGKIKKDATNPTKEAENLALTTQNILENTSVFMIEYLKKYYPDTINLCIAGGVGLNCANNSNLINKFNLSEIFVQPAANDAGITLGAAALCSEEQGYPVKKIENTNLGPTFNKKEIKEALEKAKVIYSYIGDKITECVAEKLTEQKTVAWFQDNMEYGPRALGNRSIFASPSDKKMLDKLNIIKGREQWRPLAPIVLEEDGNKYFSIKKSPFMLLFSEVNKKYASLFPAIVHVDGTTRPQTVNTKNNRKLHKLLIDYKKICGNSVLINTSFNIAGEPIVCTPKDAIKSFLKSDLDILAIGDYLVEK